MPDLARVLPRRHVTENRRWREMMMRATRLFNVLSANLTDESLDERIKILRKSEVFSVVPLNELKVLATMFEPREFIEAGEHVTVLGWERARALDTGLAFESEWAHVFTVVNGKITRWRGFLNTAARYGM